MVRVRVLFPGLLAGVPQPPGGDKEERLLSPKKTARPLGARRSLLLDVPPSDSKPEEAKAPLAEAQKKPKARPREVAKDSTKPPPQSTPTPGPTKEPRDPAPATLRAAPEEEAPQKRRRSTSEPAACGLPEVACETAPKAPGDDDVVFSWSALHVTRRDLTCLEEGNMLNDAVVDFFLQLMMSQLLPNSDIHLFSTHFYTRLTAAQAANGEVGWENVKGWTKKTSLFSRKLAIVPINAEMHWWLALIRLDAPQPTISLLDSLPGEDSRYDGVVEFLGGYLRREWRERAAAGVQMDFGQLSPSTATRLRADEQENGVDCGVFLLDNVLRLLQHTSRGSQLAEIAWCTQEAASRRRIALRRTAWRFQELGGDISVLLPARPDVLSKLRLLWGLGDSQGEVVKAKAPKLPMVLDDDDESSGLEDLTMECCAV